VHEDVDLRREIEHLAVGHPVAVLQQRVLQVRVDRQESLRPAGALSGGGAVVWRVTIRRLPEVLPDEPDHQAHHVRGLRVHPYVPGDE
jgi:hypothetical protein